MYYHGTSSNCNLNYRLLPPTVTGIISEEGRKKNLNKVFFTKDEGLARIYAGRACSKFKGNVVIYRVIPMSEVKVLSDKKGATVYYCDWGFVEIYNL